MKKWEFCIFQRRQDRTAWAPNTNEAPSDNSQAPHCNWASGLIPISPFSLLIIYRTRAANGSIEAYDKHEPNTRHTLIHPSPKDWLCFPFLEGLKCLFKLISQKGIKRERKSLNVIFGVERILAREYP
jgi:hypothetical protein